MRKRRGRREPHKKRWTKAQVKHAKSRKWFHYRTVGTLSQASKRG